MVKNFAKMLSLKTVLLSLSGKLYIIVCHVYLAIMKTLAKIGLFRMVEPLDLDYHAARPGLPEALNAANVG